jgi:4-amino-4-deoxy-L-arabinose transferase-like glycosyltransferase
MLASGEWLVPELNAQVRLQKPPLAYWAAAASYRALGRVNETAARLPSALCALATVLLAAVLAGRLFGPRAGFLAGAMLATTRIFFQQARRAETDVPLALFVTLALLAFDRGFREGRAAWRMIFFLAMGLVSWRREFPAW